TWPYVLRQGESRPLMRWREGTVAALASAFMLLAQQTTSTQTASAPAVASLTIAGDVRTPLSIPAADLKTMPRITVEVNGDDGRKVTYEGVLVAELLRRAGATLGGDLRGNALTTYVLASASDGYQVVFSLAEIDPGMTSNDVIVADTIDG